MEARIEILEADEKETKKQMVEINSSLVLLMQQLKEVQHGLQVLLTQMNNIPHPAESNSTCSRTANLTDSFKGADQEPGGEGSRSRLGEGEAPKEVRTSGV